MKFEITERNTYRLGDVIRTNVSTYSAKEGWSFVNYLDTGNITKNYIDEIQYIKIGIDKLPSRARRKVKNGNIVYSTVRPNQLHYGFIMAQPANFLVSTGFVVIDVDESKAVPEYVYYFLTHRDVTERLQAIAEQSTSAYPSIKPSDIEDLSIELPSLDEQRKIIGILKALDDKIELNNRINENLEQQAQAIYFDMFVTNADSTWKLGHLSDLIAVKYGKDHKKLADGSVPVFGSGGIMRYVERPIYEKESVLIPRKGTLNNVMYVNEPFWSVDTMFYTEMRGDNLAKFVFHFLKSKDLLSLNAGSAVPSMTTDILNAMELQIPDADSLKKFEKTVSPMYRAIDQNKKTSRQLAHIRDTLLSKLMSGELDVSEIDL